MKNAYTFKRVEMKYRLNRAQKQELLDVLKDHMVLDEYGRTTIRNIYYDTNNWLLVRNSIEKPIYKEKLRVRSYGYAGDNDKVFVELKKKYKNIVYKRRITAGNADAERWLAGVSKAPEDSQIAKEIEYFRDFYQTLHPAVFLSYEREAFKNLGPEDFRLTFDENILYRQSQLTLSSAAWGTPLLSDDETLMELKTSEGFPMWMTEFLSDHKIHKKPYSKYGSAYTQIKTAYADADNLKKGVSQYA